MTLPTIDDLKDQAKRLRADLAKTDPAMTHARALELIAHQYGARDWNTLRAAAGQTPNELALQIGDRVTGRYLNQPFTGTVLGLTSRARGAQIRVTLHFDEPVDVVTFDSFSSLRQRVTSEVTPAGVSARKTSDGNPHLVIQSVTR